MITETTLRIVKIKRKVNKFNMSKRGHGAGYGGPRAFKRPMRGKYVPYRRPYRRRQRKFRPGYDRTGGFYGRFSGPSGELKFHDINLDDAAVASTLNITNLTVIPEGNGEEQRVGRKINLKKIHVQGAIVMGSGADLSVTNDLVICMIIQDTQTNGAAFVAADFLETDAYDSYRNLANSSRFKVLWKRKYTLRVQGAAPSGAAYIHGEDIKAFSANVTCSIPMEYDNSATSGVITSVRSNNVYFVTISKSNSTALDGTARLRFSD